jgi:glycosyltransferase involved in cell wall biosynthesis
LSDKPNPPTRANLDPNPWMIRYSIIVPTLDRSYLLENTLKALLSAPRDNMEIIVSDNFSGPETKAVVDKYLPDGRLRYFRTERRLAVTDHWDFAWSKARGDYIIINCDDDMITHLGLKVLDEVIEQFSPDLVSWHTGLYYHADFDLHGNPSTLFFDVGHSNQALVLNPKNVIRRFVELDWRIFPFGTCYCLSRTMGERIIRDTGRLFWPTYPDFSSALLALVNVRPNGYVYVDSLLGYAGRSKFSNAAGFCREKKQGGDSDRLRSFFDEFGKEDKYPYHDFKLPFSLNGQVAAFSLVKTKYPEASADIEFNLTLFFEHVYRELYGLDPNPVIDQSMEPLVDAYIAGLTPAQQKAVAIAKARIWDILHPKPPKKPRLWKRFKKYFWSLFKSRPKSRPNPPAVPTPPKPTVGVKFEASGRIYGFSDSLDLAQGWEPLIDRLDVISPCRIKDAQRWGLVQSAHPLASLSRK